MRKYRKSGLATVLALGLALTACAGTGDDAGNGEASRFKIGVVAAESGPISFAGLSYMKGIRLAVDELNEADFNGDGSTLELLVEEGSEDPAQAINGANRLISNDALGVMCCLLSPVAGALAPVTEAADTPLVIFGATLPGITNPPLTFRTTNLPQNAVRVMADFIVDEVKPKSVAYTVNGDNDGMKSQLEAYKAGFDEGNVEDLGTVSFLSSDREFSGTVSELLSKDADVIVTSTTGEPGAAIVRGLRDRGYTGLIAGNPTLAVKSLFESTGGALAGVPLPIEYAPYSTIPAAEAFTEAFESEYGEIPDAYAAIGYTTVKYMAEGIKRAAANGEVTRSSLGEALAEITSLDTLWGTVDFKDGQVIVNDILISTFDDDGELVAWTP